MAQLDRATLKAFFESGDFPTEAQFSDFIDSVINIVDDSPPVSVSVTLSSAEILALFSTEIPVIAAQGVGTVIRPLVITSKSVFGGTAYTTPAFSKLEYHETDLAGTLIGDHTDTFVNSGADKVQATGLVTLANDLLENVPLVAVHTVGNPTLGNGTIEVRALFQTISV